MAEMTKTEERTQLIQHGIQRDKRITALEAALQAMVDNYVYLTDTGDFGYGDAEAEPQMVASRAALKG
jgi:hypothetical protein